MPDSVVLIVSHISELSGFRMVAVDRSEAVGEGDEIGGVGVVIGDVTSFSLLVRFRFLHTVSAGVGMLIGGRGDGDTVRSTGMLIGDGDSVRSIIVEEEVVVMVLSCINVIGDLLVTVEDVLFISVKVRFLGVID